MFMLRRTCFAIGSVLLIEHPVLQMVTHHVLALLYLAYLCRPLTFKSRKLKWVEVLTEFTGTVLSVLLMQFLRYDFSEEQIDAVSQCFICLAILLVVASIAFMIVSCCRRSRRNKRLKKIKESYEKA